MRDPRVGLARGGRGQARAGPARRRARLAWLLARLAPLVGAGGEPASQEESFTAWRRFLESLADGAETVLVFEDLHWADEALLSFLEHLADWAQGVPLLVLCTARPELYEQHPTWRRRDATRPRINLAPLSDEETARLLSARCSSGRSCRRRRSRRCSSGQAATLCTPRSSCACSPTATCSREARGLQLPDSVQALIAARLDTLSPERKSLLQDAAVIGKVFWAGALAAMGDRDPREVEQALHELSRKELVRPARTSSMEGEAEYGFWHLLVRDVCYGQIPRAARAARHRAAAAWLERKAGERAEDLADVLAHHFLTALELARRRRRRGAGAGARDARDPLPRPRRRARARTRRRARGGEPGEGARARAGRPR